MNYMERSDLPSFMSFRDLTPLYPLLNITDLTTYLAVALAQHVLETNPAAPGRNTTHSCGGISA